MLINGDGIGFPVVGCLDKNPISEIGMVTLDF